MFKLKNILISFFQIYSQIIFKKRVEVIDIKTFFKENFNIDDNLYYKGLANSYAQCRKIAINLGKWDIIKKEIKIAKLLKNCKRVIKLQVLYLVRNNKRILNFINSRI